LEKQLADPGYFADVGAADFLNRRKEADAHNAPLRAAMDELDRQESEARRAKQKAEEQQKVDEYDTAINKAVDAIRNNEAVENSEIETLTGNVTSIFLELFRIYNIHPPLRTKGWIKESLIHIFVKDGAYTYSYNRSAKDSEVFFDFLQELVTAINELF
jgi:hypothetical protein